MSKTIEELTDSGGVDVDNDLFVVRRDSGSPADYKVTFNDLANAVKSAITVDITYELTIASGTITVDPLQAPTAAYHVIDTEAAAASDDLTTIVGGKRGQLLTIQILDNSRTVTIKDATGNIYLTSGDFTLDNVRDAIQLVYNSSLNGWCEVRRANNP